MKFNVLQSGLHPVAARFHQFVDLMNSPDWQAQPFLSQRVAFTKRKEIFRALAQFVGCISGGTAKQSYSCMLSIPARDTALNASYIRDQLAVHGEIYLLLTKLVADAGEPMITSADHGDDVPGY